MVLGQVVTVLLVVAALAGAVTLAEVYRRRYRLARVFAVAAVAAVVTGWGVGQYPWIPDRAARRPRAGIPVMAHPDRGMEPDLMRCVQRYK